MDNGAVAWKKKQYLLRIESVFALTVNSVAGAPKIRTVGGGGVASEGAEIKSGRKHSSKFP